jgi:uncharacterized membrane protein
MTTRLAGVRRLEFIDATRAVALSFVFISHFAYGYFGAGKGAIHEALTALGMVASPSFVLVSGILLGFLYQSSPTKFVELRTRFIDRGIFLLTIGHVLILGAHLPLGRGPVWGFITDTIGVSMIAGVLLIDKVRPASRLALSVGLYAASWLLALFWQPESAMLRVLRDSLSGTAFQSVYVFNFPLLPWFSLYFAATVLGERLALAKPDDSGSPSARVMLGRLGTMTIVGGLLGVAFSIALLFAGPTHRALVDARVRGGLVNEAIVAAEELAEPHPTDPWLELSSPFQKRPPSPVYFAFFGGAGLALLYCCASAERFTWLRGVVRYLSRAGRASFFIFVVQYYVFYAALSVLNLPVSAWWPIYLVGSSIALIHAGTLWNRRGFNRWITVGYPWTTRRSSPQTEADWAVYVTSRNR